MSTECHPITVLPHLPALFRDYTELRTAPPDAPVRRFYPFSPFDAKWQRGTQPRLQADRSQLADALLTQNQAYQAGDATFANIDLLRQPGTRAVVTGQQVGLFGGPLLTLLKAATAIRKAQTATEAGITHVPIFWMATEDHDLDEVNQATILTKAGLRKLRSSFPEHSRQPVGNLQLGPQIEPVLAELEELLAYAPVTELLRASYTPQDTLATAFGKFLSGVFRDHGLIVLDASPRAFHQMGEPVLRYAIEHATELREAILRRNRELEAAGYGTQVLVSADSTLLFLIDDEGSRVTLHSSTPGEFKAGRRAYTAQELLNILDSEPERISPNALLRPIFQDAILPTSAYIGGPAEIAYFAQSQPIYDAILGTSTPALPRLSATLVPPATRNVLDQHELSVRDTFTTADLLAQRLGARSMPIEGKRKLAAAGNALDAELTELQQWMSALSPNLGHSAEIAANKMRYQMNRLRRMAANHQLEREGHLRKHAEALTGVLYPDAHPQERLLTGAQMLGYSTIDLPSLLVAHGNEACPGHRVLDI